MFLVVIQAFSVFIVRIYFFSLCHLGLCAITEWEPIKRGALWFNSFQSLKNDKYKSCQSP